MKELGQHTYIAIDLKSYYASVECVVRGLDPLTTCLVVADSSRTSKTICLAVSPSLKAYGIGGRARLFEVEQRVREVNRERRRLYGRPLLGKSFSALELAAHPEMELDFIVAVPRMRHYMEKSAQIVGAYYRHVAEEDVLIYSVDEVFIDATPYLPRYGISASELTRRMITDVFRETGITATGGIGSNMFLCKVAMDIVAKHAPADKNGVRIAELDEQSFRHTMWGHRPIIDFWRVGSGMANRLAAHGMYTMGDVARQSVRDEELLYQLFGVNAELLIDHAWGWESCPLSLARTYKPKNHSLSSGQVLARPYSFEEARIVVLEMADNLSLQLVEAGLRTDQIVLNIGYDAQSPMTDNRVAVAKDHYGRPVPRPAHGSQQLPLKTSSCRFITRAADDIFHQVVNPSLLIRRINIVANHVSETSVPEASVQLSLFEEATPTVDQERLDAEHRLQETILNLKHTFGKNAILRAISYEDAATARQRNQQIGGHRS